MNNTSYTYDAEWFNYIQHCNRNKLRLNRYISEALIFTENSSTATKYQKLVALDEAVGEKISKAWDAVVNFIRRMWAKFTNNVTKLVSSQTSYLEKYKDIILNKKPKFQDVKMYPCEKGIDNIIKNPIKPVEYNTLVGEGSIGDNIDKEDQSGVDARNQMITKYLLRDWQNGKGGSAKEQNFLQWATDFFSHGNGAEETRTANRVNLHDMYNFCHDLKNMQDVVQKDYDEMEKMSTDFGKRIEQAQQKANQTKNQGQQGQEEDKYKNDDLQDGKPATEPVNTEKTSKMGRFFKVIEDGGKRVWKLLKGQGESAVYSMVYGTYITEAEINGGATADNKDTSAAVAAQTSSANARADAQNRTNDAAGEGDKHLAGINDASKKINAYLTAAKDMLAAKLSAISFINHEYMQILNFHIKSYVGTPEAKDNSNNQQTPATEYQPNKRETEDKPAGQPAGGGQ